MRPVLIPVLHRITLAVWLGLGALPGFAQGGAPMAAALVSPAQAWELGVMQAAPTPEIAQLYAERGGAPILTGPDQADRRAALLRALARAGDHGLPEDRHSPERLRAILAAADGPHARGRAEALAAGMLVAYARDLSAGVIRPASVDPLIDRAPPRPDARQILSGFDAAADPVAYLDGLAPRSPGYQRLIAARKHLAAVVAAGGWGPDLPPGPRIEAGDTGPRVIALRDRLIAMGYLPRLALARLEGPFEAALRRFQADHGLIDDGVVGPATLAALNIGAETRLEQVIVALERERWLPDRETGRQVVVNLTDFHARLYEDGVPAFVTRAVVGAVTEGKHTAEFSDQIEYMEVNPDWTVPRGIIARDYLPRLQNDPTAAGYLNLIDAQGNTIPRETVDFTAYTARTFPYTLRQPPGASNALGVVKFMFPNTHAIYLHDTPERHLFAREQRTYSSGCIRLQDPQDFAAVLLSAQAENPRAVFEAALSSGRQTRISLRDPVPVHLTYATAFVLADGQMQFRKDIYGRDARIWEALARAGVSALPPPEGS